MIEDRELTLRIRLDPGEADSPSHEFLGAEVERILEGSTINLGSVDLFAVIDEAQVSEVRHV